MKLGHGRQEVHGQLGDVEVRLAQQRRKLHEDRGQGAAVQVGSIVPELGHKKKTSINTRRQILHTNSFRGKLSRYLFPKGASGHA